MYRYKYVPYVWLPRLSARHAPNDSVAGYAL